MAKNSKEKSSKDSSSSQSAMADPRFASVASDSRFKPLRVKDTVVVPADDERFKNIQQLSTDESLSDPRGRKFSIHKTAKKTGTGKSLPTKPVKTTKKKKNPATGSNVIKVKAPSQEETSTSRKRKLPEEPERKNLKPSDMLGISDDSSDEEENKLLELNKDIEMAPSDWIEPKTAKEKRRLEQLLDPNLDIIRGVDQFSGSSSSEEDSSSEEEEEEEYDWGGQDKNAQWDVDGHDVEETRRIAVCNVEWDRFQAQDLLVVLKSFAPAGGQVICVSVYLSEFGKERLKEETKEGPLEVRALPRVEESNEENSEEKNYEALRKYHFNQLKYYYAVAECDSVTTARVIYKALDGTCLESGGIVDLRYIPDDMTFDDTPVSTCGSMPANYEAKFGESFSRSQYVRAKNSWDVDDEIRKKTLEKCAYVEDIKDDQIIKAYIASDSEEDGEEEGEEGENTLETVYTSNFESAPQRSKEDTKKRLGWLLNTKFDLVKEAEMQLLSRVLGDAAFTGEGIVKYSEEAADALASQSNSQQEISQEEQESSEAEASSEEEASSSEADEEDEEMEERQRKPSSSGSSANGSAKSSILKRKAASNVVHKEEAFDDDEEEEDEKDEYKNLLPFERYLLKRKKREKAHKKAMKQLAKGGKQRERDDICDIPDELKNDPFFKEELEIRKKEKLRIEKEKREEEDREMAQEQREKQRREAEMALLMHQDGDGGPQSVDMRQLVKRAKEEATTGGKTKKLSRWKLAKLNKKAKRLAKEGVYLPSPAEEAASNKLTSAPLPAPLTAPSDVVNDERFANIFDNPRVNLDPSHPEYVKHKTPYLAELAKEVQKRQLSKKRRLQ